ncbi:hypothetical protein GCM10023194_61760 [Planotetraspora phitsanulokensis]|uniref:Uncharacterized protein n=1 Tax=Planotetraspora phitsanulokensis TaxID=575192 RepID=A0A8J3U2Z3_9ACTN|nr:hypothetical protein [Planotetraspora phitsanulokensis]GII37603.1 hypothetical protein Pph01_26060 [Planotetraspora phitsanulokensis]
MYPSPSPQGWAAGRFGDRAGAVRRQIVASLTEAVANAQDAQRWSRSDKHFTYGHTLMTRRYEALAEGFRHEPGFQTVRPYASPHRLVLLDGNLLLPFRYAEDDTTPVSTARISDGRISALVRELFNRFGPAAAYRQEELDLSIGWDGERNPDDRPSTEGADGRQADGAAIRPSLPHLPEDTRLVPVAYAGNAHTGLLRLYWGEAELLDDLGHLRWLHCEPIPLTIAPSSGGVPEAVGAARFDQGALPDLALRARPPVERANETMFPVHSEAQQETAVTADDEHP